MAEVFMWGQFRMKYIFMVFILLFGASSQAMNIIPVGNDNNTLYYKIGGGSNFHLPPVSDTASIKLDASADIGIGPSCGAFNPAIAIKNSINDLKNSIDTLETDIVASATASIIALPMYLFAQANPSAYQIFNNGLLSAHKQLDISVKSCETIRSQISQGKNPYQDWATISAGDSWKKKISLDGNTDINSAKKDIDAHSGDDGVAWVTGKKDTLTGTIRAGGKDQDPVNVIADTTKAGYNALLSRSNLDEERPADSSGSSSELARFFPTPKSAEDWITNVIGDQKITTCNDDNCKANQASTIGHGLLPHITSCAQDKDDCADNIRKILTDLVTGNQEINRKNLDSISADGTAISPEVVNSLKNLDSTEQSILVNKLSQEIAMERIINKALIARNILMTGSQVPVISANNPAQVIIEHGIKKLDNDIQSLTFESNTRKQLMSDTVSQILSYSKEQERASARITASPNAPQMMDNGALPLDDGDKK
jgi:integrating conjugative element protein (TIGR03755 family)